MDTFLPLLAEKILSVAAGLLIFTAQVILLNDVIKNKISPGLLSWIGWSLLMGTSLISQILDAGWQWSLMGLLISTLGCLAIFFTAWKLNNYLFKKSDWTFLFLGLVCLIIYLKSKDPWLTTGFAILADFIVGIPTLLHALNQPKTQKTNAWLLGLISWAITLIICFGNSWLYALFPIYLFLYNIAMVILTHRIQGELKVKK